METLTSSIPFLGAMCALFGGTGTLVGVWLKRRTDTDTLKASPYDALASRVVTLEASDAAKHNQIVQLSTKVMTIEATSETRRVLLTSAHAKHAGVVAHVDGVEAWIEQKLPGGDFPRLDPDLRAPVATA